MRFILAAAILALGAPVAAQPGNPAVLQAAQREAMGKLAAMDGVWRGNAWTLTPAGRHDVLHTERIGPFLGGTVKVIEGRAYNADGSVGFNAFGIIFYDPAAKTYSMHSYAMGHAGDFPLDVRPDGYVWQIPAGPGTIIRYTATIKDGAWREIGERIAGTGAPVQMFEMNLKRVGDTSWPAGEPVPMK
jgi:hypothetical protein